MRRVFSVTLDILRLDDVRKLDLKPSEPSTGILHIFRVLFYAIQTKFYRLDSLCDVRNSILDFILLTVFARPGKELRSKIFAQHGNPPSDVV